MKKKPLEPAEWLRGKFFVPPDKTLREYLGDDGIFTLDGVIKQLEEYKDYLEGFHP